MRDNSLYKRRQAETSQACYIQYTEVWIYVSHWCINRTVYSNCPFSKYIENIECTWHWHALALICKAVKVNLKRREEEAERMVL